MAREKNQELAPQISSRFLFRQNQSVAGLAAYLRETGRNALVHDHAEIISVVLRRTLKGEGALDILSDGVGMDETNRKYAGCCLGSSTSGSNGGGFRQSAATIALRMEINTIHRDDPNTAWRIIIPLVDFFLGILHGTWRGDWERIPRIGSRIPTDQRSGTLVTITDFRAANADAPQNPALYRSTERQFTEENIRQYILNMFPPDYARRFLVNGTRIKPRPVEGFQLWKEQVSVKPGLGEVSADIRLSETGTGNWLQISGTAAAIAFRDFHAQFREFNPELANRIPAIFERERRLAGFLRFSVLEQYPTMDRRQLLFAFYTSPEALMVVDELVRIGEKVEDALRRYEEQPKSALTEGVIAEFIGNIHQAQNLKPGMAPGGEVVVVEDGPQIQALQIHPTAIHLEPWSGNKDEPKDEAVVCVKNPMEGETFAWDDRRAGILKDIGIAKATVVATAYEGVHVITIRSEQHPERERTIQITIRHREALPPSGAFCLAPMGTQLVVGQERAIRIRSQGPSVGPYDWSVEPSTDKGKPAARLEIHASTREVRFTAFKPGRFIITCRDRSNKSLTACSKIEALATREHVDTVDPPPPSGVRPTVVFTGVPGSGTGNPQGQRPSHLGTVMHIFFRGVLYEFALRSDPVLHEPFYVDPTNKRILVSDAGLGRYADRAMQLQHVAWCAATGALLIMLGENVIDSPQDPVCGELIQMVTAGGVAILKT